MPIVSSLTLKTEGEKQLTGLKVAKICMSI